jgi:hypothetical protein
MAAEDMPDRNPQHAEERFSLTREQLVALLDEALKVRGVY